jgi:DNA repair exonuclease SbcCD ATPase subunit
VSPDFSSKLAQAQAEVKAAQSKITDLESRVRRTPRASRQTVINQVAAAQSQLKLAQLRFESLEAISNFEKGTAGGQAGGGLGAQVDELERSVPLMSSPAKAPSQTSGAQANLPPQMEPIAPSGILGHAENLLTLARKQQTLTNSIDLTDSLNASVQKLREQLIPALQQINTQANTVAAQLDNPNPTALEEIEHLDDLTKLYKLNVNALMPLTQMSSVLEMYSANLKLWREMVNVRSPRTCARSQWL